MKKTIFCFRSKNLICAVISGLFFSGILLLGSQFEVYGKIGFSLVKNILLLFVLWIVTAALIFAFLSISFPKNDKTLTRSHCLTVFLLCLAALEIVYLIIALGVYPGFFAYDAPWQWDMYRTHEITEHHPVLHTFIIGKLISLGLRINGSAELGIFFYTLFQSFVTAISFAYLFTYLYRRNISGLSLVLTFLWMGFFPSIDILVMSTTKDCLFAPFCCILGVLSIELLTESDLFFSKIYRPVMWIISVVSCTILRNNAIYPMIAFLLVLIPLNVKVIKKYLLMLAVSSFLFLLYQGPFVHSVASPVSDNREFLSVPIQQIMYVYTNEYDDLSDREKTMIETLFTEFGRENYNPKISDTPKSQLNYDYYKNNSSEVRRFYLELGKEYPMDYFNAFGMLNYGFWYPCATLVTDSSGREAYAICNCYEPFTMQSKLPVLQKYFSFFAGSDLVVRNNITKWLFSAGTYSCIFLFTFVLALIYKKKEVLALSFTFLFWLTFLLGPVVLIRYTAFIFYQIPLFVFMIHNIKTSSNS